MSGLVYSEAGTMFRAQEVSQSDVDSNNGGDSTANMSKFLAYIEAIIQPAQGLVMDIELSYLFIPNVISHYSSFLF